MKGIIFTENIDKILDDRKTNTRRVMKQQPIYDFCFEQDGEWLWHERDHDDDMMGWWPSYENGLKPRYKAGEIVYVKETWGFDNHNWFYKANFNESDLSKLSHLLRWRNPMYMPQTAARIFLLITDVRAERLQDISVEAVWREGVDVGDVPPEPDPHSMIHNWDELSKARQDEYIEIWAKSHYFKCLDKAREANRAFIKLWDGLNAKSGHGWDKNPWVWAYTFERTTATLSPADQQGLQGAAQGVLLPAT